MGDKVAEWRRQVLLMEHDHMVQALAAQRPDHRSAIAFTCVVMVPSILMAQLKRSSLLTAVNEQQLSKFTILLVVEAERM